MNTTRTRAAALLAASVMAFAGCAAPGGAPAASEGGKTTIRFAWWGNAPRHESTQRIIEAFEAANPDIDVTGEPGDFAAYFDKLATQVASGDAPDVITLGGAYLPEYAQRGALLDMSEVPNGLDLKDIDQGAVTNGQVEGQQFGVTTGVNALAVIVNPQVFEAAGVALPDDRTWTWQDYARIARELSAGTPDDVHGASGGLTHDSLDAFARQRGEILYTADGKLGLSRQTVTDFLDFSLRMTQDKGAPPATVITEQVNIAQEQSLMGMGKSGMVLTWSNYLTPLMKASGAPLRLLQLPGEADRPGIWLQSSQFFTVNAKTRAPEAATRLVSYLVNSPEAGRIVLNDRGVPTNAKVRDAIASALPTAGQEESRYIGSLSELPLQPTFIGPTGSTQVSDITQRALSDVLFERVTPAQAAERWMSESEQAIS